MRDKKFFINSIKMDLHRVATAVGDITKPVPRMSVEEFLTHALNEFDRIEVTPLEKILRKQLVALSNSLDTLSDPHKRLIWTEDIITIRCRVG